MQLLSPATIRSFRKKIYAHYRRHGRDLPWRTSQDPYHILVSEIMLQQTQVERVIEKYREFLADFPDFASLARAPLPKLLGLWQGLGYNRRALFLRNLAQTVVSEHNSTLPRDPQKLLALPGIGRYTASAIMVFAFNQPAIVIDTNIRRLYIHEFSPERGSVHDRDLVPLIQQTLDRRRPRIWYNALMDYGALLKKGRENPNKRSAHYYLQSPFENSNRQVRSRILKALLDESPLALSRIVGETGIEKAWIERNLVDLEKEGFLKKHAGGYAIHDDL